MQCRLAVFVFLLVAAKAASTASAAAFCMNSARYFMVGRQPSSVCAADLDGDGDQDLAVANKDDDNVSVLRSHGDGTYAAAVEYPAGNNPCSIYAADLDGDGDQDTVTIDLLAAKGGINSWEVTIVDESDQTVQTFAGNGAPPASIVWNGIDQNFDATVGEGTYKIYFRVTDRMNHYAVAGPLEIKVQY